MNIQSLEMLLPRQFADEIRALFGDEPIVSSMDGKALADSIRATSAAAKPWEGN